MAVEDPSTLIQYLHTYMMRNTPGPSRDAWATAITQTIWMFLKRLIEPDKKG